MKDKIADFTAKLNSNPELDQKFEAISVNSQAELADALASLATEAGVPISSAEWLAALEADAVLTDDTLADVAGGASSADFNRQYSPMVREFLARARQSVG